MRTFWVISVGTGIPALLIRAPNSLHISSSSVTCAWFSSPANSAKLINIDGAELSSSTISLPVQVILTLFVRIGQYCIGR